MAGEVRGKRVLDVGCASGGLSEGFVERGASVVGVDLNPRLIERARGRLGSRAEFRVADIAAPMPFLETGSFDVVAASLVLHYLADWGPPLREFARILRPGGVLLISTHHPTQDVMIATPPAPYFETVLLTDTWRKGGREFQCASTTAQSARSSMRSPTPGFSSSASPSLFRIQLPSRTVRSTTVSDGARGSCSSALCLRPAETRRADPDKDGTEATRSTCQGRVERPTGPLAPRSIEPCWERLLVHVWSTRHRNRAVRNGLQRWYIVLSRSSDLAPVVRRLPAAGQIR